MDKSPAAPKTLQEAIRFFTDPDTCLAFMVEIRWPNGVTCPTCGSDRVLFIPTRRTWECREKHPRRQFSAKVGTIFEDSPLGLDKWFAAIWLIANAKNGISSYEIGRALGVTQKTGWFMLHRIRVAMKSGTFIKLSGRVEADETFIGPHPKNMHAHKRAKLTVSRREDQRYISKAIVAGVLERNARKGHTRVRAAVVPTVRSEHLMPLIDANVEPGSEMITDMLRSYWQVRDEYIHSVIDKTVSYVKGHVHTNGLENFWSLLKRALKGTYVAVESFHLGAYVDEQVFRFNERSVPRGDGGRFVKVLQSVMGRRLTYKGLIGSPGIAIA
jgi:transposase-like protein